MSGKRTPMTMSGFCMFEGLDNSHRFCRLESCTCDCGHDSTENGMVLTREET